jgi:DNA/RNA endonuclease G (NUC1)
MKACSPSVIRVRMTAEESSMPSRRSVLRRRTGLCARRPWEWARPDRVGLRPCGQPGHGPWAGDGSIRGHLVRRASAVWRDMRAEAAGANADTLHYTNAAPQAAKFKQGLDP